MHFDFRNYIGQGALEHIIIRKKLNDGDINHAQKILKVQFPKLNVLYVVDTIPGQSNAQITGCKLYIAFRVITGSLQQPSIVMMV